MPGLVVRLDKAARPICHAHVQVMTRTTCIVAVRRPVVQRCLSARPTSLGALPSAHRGPREPRGPSQAVHSMVMLDLSTTTASNIIAVSLGLLSLMLGVVVPAVGRWRRGRQAELEVRFERFWRLDTSRLASRIVIKNHGPASAWQVALQQLADSKGQQLDLDSLATSATPPVAQLLPGQEFHILMEFSLAQGDPTSVDAEWQDRSGSRRAKFITSPQYV